ncbi:Serine/threonine-protein kinase, partial [Coemansia sp. RSA 2598]
MAAQILCATNDVDKLFAADSNASLGSRLEFSLNLDMITDHSRTEDIADEPAACEPSVQRPPISRRKTLRRLLSTHVRRTSELHICGGGGGGGEASVSAAQEPETPIKHRQIDVDAQPAAAGFQLELVNLPSPFASFDRGLRCWPDSSHSSAGTASAADADKSSVLTARQLPSRRESIGHRYFYSGIEHEPKEGDEATRDDPEIPVDPDASETPADGTPPQRGRSLMFKPLMDVTAVGALIENIADGKPKSIDEVKPQVAADIKPRAQSNGIRRGIMGSLRRTAAAITTTASNVHSNRRQRSTAKASSAAAGGNEDAEPEVRPLSHKICPIETVQTVQTDEPDASEQQPRANDKDNDNDNDNGSAAQQPVRNVRRRAGTLNLGAARDPIRHDPLKQAPAASGDNASRPLRRRHQSQRIAPRAGSDDALMVPGYIPIAVSLKSTRSRQFLLNTPLGEFEIQRTLGQGSYGKVKLMRSALSHELFAVKIIKRYPPHKHRRGHHEYRKAKTLDRRVVREANLAAILGQLHPHIVPLHDFRVTDTHFYLFYAYVNGVTLAERVGSAGLSEDEARAIFKPVTETIAFCHRYSVIHRDIKLENVLLDYADEGDNARPLLLPREGSKSSRNVVSNANSTGPGSMADAAADPTGARSSADYRAASVFDGRVKLIDFGLANFFDGTSLMETFCGSLPYTAPEILRGDAYVGPEIDVWSLGVLLY